MKITNNDGLPEPIFQAIKNRPYNRGDSDISVTGLISPPRILQLQDRLKDVLEVEASDSLYALSGSAIHATLEWAGATLDKDRYILEQRLFAEANGWRVSGQIDVIDLKDSLLTDYKNTSHYVAIFGAKEEWTQQLNIYRWLCHVNGYNISRLEIFANLRDWNKMKSYRDREYPQVGFKVIPIEVWPLDVTEKFVHDRVAIHQLAVTTPTASLPMCTSDERWTKGGGWAVKVDGHKSAKKICDTKQEALSWMSANVKDPATLAKTRLEPRAGEQRRCIGYCPVRFHCDHGKGVAKK